MGDGGSRRRSGEPRAEHALAARQAARASTSPTEGLRIEALGLRNPWRFSFDRANGDLYIGDVGQDAIEEIDYTPRRAPALENYGWDVYEGRSKFEDKAARARQARLPVAQYTPRRGLLGHRRLRLSRRTPCRLPRAATSTATTAAGTIWSFKRRRTGKATGLRREAFKVDEPDVVRRGPAGELYAVSLDGTIYRLTRSTA